MFPQLSDPKVNRLGRERWLNVGTFWEHSTLIRNWGVPNAITLNCRGRGFTFLNWDHLFWAVRGRLSLSQLRLVAVACSIERNPYGHPELFVLMARHSKFSAASRSL
jgi:hypothetical protein